MAMNFLSAKVTLELDASKIKPQLAKAKALVMKSAMAMEKAFLKVGATFLNVFKKMAATIKKYAKYIIVGIIGISAAMFKLAAAAYESENLYSVSMGRMASSTRKWSIELSDSLFMNEFELRKFTGLMNVMFTAMGISAKTAQDMAQSLTELSYDISSFYDIPFEEAYRKLQSGMMGITRPLKAIGIVIMDSTVKQHALNNAIWDGVGAMTDQMKIQARYELIMNRTEKAQGDMARTINQTENVFRSLYALLKETGTMIGFHLTPKITALAIEFRQWLFDNQKDIVDWAGTLIKNIEKVIDKVWDLIKLFTVDFSRGMEVVKNIMIEFSRALIDTFIIVGVAIGKALIKGLTPFGGPDAKLILEEYRELGGMAAVNAIKGWDKIFVVTGKEGPWAFPHGRDTKTPFWLEPSRKALAIQNLRIKAIREEIGVIPQLTTAWGDFVKVTAKAIPSMAIPGQPDAAVPFIPTEGVRGPRAFEEDVLLEQLETERLLAEEMTKQKKIQDALVKSAMEKYDVAKRSLDFEYDILGLTNDERERAIDMARLESDLVGLTAEHRNELMEKYGLLLDKIQDKQNSLSYSLNQWMDKTMEAGRRLGDILTNSFDRIGDNFARMLMQQEVNWKLFAAMFIQELVAMIMQLTIALMLKTALGMPTGGVLSGINSIFAGEGLHDGGVVTQTGLAKVDKGEVFSGVNNEMGFGAITVNNFVGENIDVEVMDEERVINISKRTSIQSAASDGAYRRAHKAIR